jgi:hypothetical protein
VNTIIDLFTFNESYIKCIGSFTLRHQFASGLFVLLSGLWEALTVFMKYSVHAMKAPYLPNSMRGKPSDLRAGLKL